MCDILRCWNGGIMNKHYELMYIESKIKSDEKFQISYTVDRSMVMEDDILINFSNTDRWGMEKISVLKMLLGDTYGFMLYYDWIFDALVNLECMMYDDMISVMIKIATLSHLLKTDNSGITYVSPPIPTFEFDNVGLPLDEELREIIQNERDECSHIITQKMYKNVMDHTNPYLE